MVGFCHFATPLARKSGSRFILYFFHNEFFVSFAPFVYFHHSKPGILKEVYLRLIAMMIYLINSSCFTILLQRMNAITII